MTNLIESAKPTSIPVIVTHDFLDVNSTAYKFIERFGNCWLKVSGIRGTYFLFDKKDEIVFVKRGPMLAAYPNITKADFAEAWEKDRLVPNLLSSIHKLDTAVDSRHLQLLAIMDIWSIEI